MKTKKVRISVKDVYQNDVDKSDTLNYFSLYRYATKWNIFLMLIGIIFALLKSCSQPLIFIIYGEFIASLVNRQAGTGTTSRIIFLPVFGGGKTIPNATAEEIQSETINDSTAFAIWVSLVTLIQFTGGIVCTECFNYTAIRQITRIRIEFFRSLMRQEVGWYDVEGGENNFSVYITEHMEKIRDGIAEKVSQFLFSIETSIICITVAFIYGWKLSLILASYLPITVLITTFIGKFQAKLTTKELNSYSAATNVAEEVLSGIRTVFAFGGEKIEIERYNKRLIKAKKAVKIKGLLSGLGGGATQLMYFISIALGFWFGIQFVLEDRHKAYQEYTPASLLIVFFGLFVAASSMSGTVPSLDSFAAARASAAIIFKIIDRRSKINSMSNEGKVPSLGIQGNIVFKKVFFSYPSRPDVQILRGLDLEIQPGQSVGIVGDSGNGKSTCLQLLQRFYDPNHGEILIDGCDIRTLNINMLRSNIATVGQEPVLFSTTIGENIRYGNPDVTDKDIVAAAQMSGAHDFIANLPQGYNTLVGEKGSQLSGGQKQRIAIARALIQNPKILLLDEATSALDYQSEKFVQETLDKASKGRTTITVSHRLSAIRNADRILFIDKGLVIENGTHNELMTLKGRYYEMITAGRLKDGDDDENKAKVDELHKSGENFSVKTQFNESRDEEDYFRRLSVDVMEKKVKKSEKDIEYWKVFKRILKLLKPEWLIMCLAAVCACVMGATLPGFAVLFGDIFAALSSGDGGKVSKDALVTCIGFVGIGVIAFFCALCQTYFFSKAGVNLASRMRSMTFTAMLLQECGWYDDKNNSPAALSARLTGDAGSIQTAIGYPLGTVFQTISTIIVAIIIALSYSVRVSLVTLVALPFILLTVFLETKITSRTSIIEKQLAENGTKIATEAITNIRTVASLRQEKYMIERYVTEMNKLALITRKKDIWHGIISSLSQAIPFLAYAITFLYGGRLIANKEIEFQNVIKITESMMYAIIVLGQTLILVPSFATASVGAHRIFKIIDRIPMISSPNVANKSQKPDKNNDIDYKKIDFHYPTRPDVKVLNNFNLHVAEGKTIALVGPSGCGKSTCIQLLQRLYDPEHGRIHIGLDEIYRDIALNDLRSKLSIVSQEPVLFDRTIAENIAYGDNSREVSIDDIINAAKLANAHDFIAQLPLGYETSVGSKTAQLSGGQKQRIAIARALIRNPKILLLDEATSALDSHSEQIIQQALDSARSGRTCIVIAHRLSTIQNADAIGVLSGGNIVEYGTHDELLAAGGIYTRLYNAQK